MWPWNLMDDLKKTQDTSSILHQALCIISKPSVNSNWSYSPELLNSGQNWWLVVPCDLEIWWMTLNNRTPSLLCQALCIISKPSLNSNWSYSPQTLNSGRNLFFSSPVTTKFDGRPWKTIGHLFYTTPSLEHYFKAIGDFKLELQSRNIQFGSKSISLAVWPWNLTDDLEKQQGTSPKAHQALCIILSPYVNSNGSNSQETAKLGFDLCDFDL